MNPSHACMFNHELLVSYVTHSVTPGERVTVERHLAHCSICRQEIKELEQTWLALDSWNEEVESVQPRLNDFRLRLNRVRQKPSLREIIQHQIDSFLAPFRWIPTSPVLAVIITGLFAYAGWQTQWGNQPAESNPIQPTFVSNPSRSVPLSANPSNMEIAEQTTSLHETNNQVYEWNSLVQNTNRSDKSDGIIRMATDGLVYERLANFPSKDVLSNFMTPSLRPASMTMVSGQSVRLE